MLSGHELFSFITDLFFKNIKTEIVRLGDILIISMTPKHHGNVS